VRGYKRAIRVTNKKQEQDRYGSDSDSGKATSLQEWQVDSPSRIRSSRAIAITEEAVETTGVPEQRTGGVYWLTATKKPIEDNRVHSRGRSKSVDNRSGLVGSQLESHSKRGEVLPKGHIVRRSSREFEIKSNSEGDRRHIEA
jgi:hypothetical protein